MQIGGQINQMSRDQTEVFSSWRLISAGGTAAMLPGMGLALLGILGLIAGTILSAIVAFSYSSIRYGLRNLIWYRRFFCLYLFGTLLLAILVLLLPTNKQVFALAYLLLLVGVLVWFMPLFSRIEGKPLSEGRFKAGGDELP